jgi:hypothetical protein
MQSECSTEEQTRVSSLSSKGVTVLRLLNGDGQVMSRIHCELTSNELPKVLVVGEQHEVFLRINRSSYYRQFQRLVFSEAEVIRSPR